MVKVDTKDPKTGSGSVPGGVSDSVPGVTTLAPGIENSVLFHSEDRRFVSHPSRVNAAHRIVS